MISGAEPGRSGLGAGLEFLGGWVPVVMSGGPEVYAVEEVKIGDLTSGPGIDIVKQLEIGDDKVVIFVDGVASDGYLEYGRAATVLGEANLNTVEVVCGIGACEAEFSRPGSGTERARVGAINIQRQVNLCFLVGTLVLQGQR